MKNSDEIVKKCAGICQRAKSLLLLSLVTAICSGMAACAQAQTFAEWFAQKKTQKKYLLQQIAALQVYSTYLKQGYRIATDGLGSITDKLKSEYQLHGTYYNRLTNVDPAVKNDPMVRDILNWQRDIMVRTGEISKVTGISPQEKAYLTQVCAAVLKDCDQQLQTLQTLIGDQEVAMADAERLTLLTRIHTDMEANYRFASGFAGQVKLLAIKRDQELRQVNTGKRLNNIK